MDRGKAIAKQVLRDLSKIKYGFVGEDGEVLPDEDVYDKRLQSPSELMASGAGDCWDQTEYSRSIFKKSFYPARTYFIGARTVEGDRPNHTFLTFVQDGSFFWLEHAWGSNQGIHRYESRYDLLADVRARLVKSWADYEIIEISVLSYTMPEFGIGVDAFYDFVKNSGVQILLEDRFI